MLWLGLASVTVTFVLVSRLGRTRDTGLYVRQLPDSIFNDMKIVNIKFFLENMQN